jgi:uncharacterized protein YdcH (DUF465 family)
MVERSQEERKAALIEKDPEFKTLVQEHRSLDEKLKEFDRKVYLSPDEEMERKRLQKLKRRGRKAARSFDTAGGDSLQATPLTGIPFPGGNCFLAQARGMNDAK